MPAKFNGNRDTVNFMNFAPCPCPLATLEFGPRNATSVPE